ncbi:hypothetical protein GCK72_020337 [Caenorhabditis remanei]|uniref:Uncharacterized protein n=1 Tax=Caenorhabditis remanei TaxID=31234 RepID=A0A6A5GF89_CAERE|nr:hypothetical protein GCK72_020337 [Caenorhabditis remanei]KAF1753780.1 hypothetical protein GCK72_020337 [Caenorhabditis remanei]
MNLNPHLASTSSTSTSSTSSASSSEFPRVSVQSRHAPRLPHHLSINGATQQTHHPIYACSDENSYYASPIFLTRTIDEPPKKPAPTLSRQSTCRPTSQLYLPSKKRKTR